MLSGFDGPLFAGASAPPGVCLRGQDPRAISEGKGRMAMAKKITFDQEAREALREGVHKFARAVKGTLGPRGRYAVIDRGWGAPKVTKDGASVAEEVELSDAVEDMAARLMREAATKTAKEAGDGSTTSTVLAEVIFTRGMRNVVAGANAIMVQRGLTEATRRAVRVLDDMSIKVKDDQIGNIAAIAANNDESIGKIIANAMKKVGRDGVISVTQGKGVSTYYYQLKETPRLASRRINRLGKY